MVQKKIRSCIFLNNMTFEIHIIDKKQKPHTVDVDCNMGTLLHKVSSVSCFGFYTKVFEP